MIPAPGGVSATEHPPTPERSKNMRVEIWSDIACPWCYIGKARFEKGLADFAHRDDIEVVHRSFELDPNRPKGDTAPVIDMLAKKYGRTLDEARAMEAHVASNAHSEGLEYRTEGRDHGNTFDIHRLLHLAKERGRQNELLDLAYRANFAEERSVFDTETLVRLGVEAGLDETEVRSVLADERVRGRGTGGRARSGRTRRERCAVLRPRPPLRHLRRAARRGLHPGPGTGLAGPGAAADRRRRRRVRRRRHLRRISEAWGFPLKVCN